MESSFNKTMMLHVATEAVVIAGVSYVLSKKCSNNSARIDVLEKKLTDSNTLVSQLEAVVKSQQELLVKHEQIFAQMFNNRLSGPDTRQQSRPKKPVVQVEEEEDEEEIARQELKRSKRPVGAKKVVVAPVQSNEPELEPYVEEIEN